MARLPGMRRGRAPLARGDRVYAKFCPDCGLPRCPCCDGCCDPIWVVPMGFQCICGWSGVIDGNGLGAEALEALASLWDGVEPLPVNAEGIII